MATYKQKMKEFSDFPSYKDHYIKAFDEMLKVRKAHGKNGAYRESHWKTGRDVFDWWVEEFRQNVKGQMTIDEYLKGGSTTK